MDTIAKIKSAMAKLSLNPWKKKRADIFGLLVIVVVAFLVRLYLARLETEVGVDSVHYILMGDNMAHLRSLDTWDTTGGRWTLPPLFPLLIAFFRMLGAGLEWSGHLASVTAGTLLIFPIYYLTRRLFNNATARTASIIAAFTPILVDYSVVILTELLFAACMLSMMVFVVRAFSKEGKQWDPFWSGIFAGLAFLTKAFGVFLFPFLLLSFLFGRGGQSKAKPVRQVIFAALGCLVLAVPYWIALYQYTGRFVMDGKGIGQEIRLYAKDLTEEHSDPRYSGELTDDGSDFLINVHPAGVRPEGVTTGGFLFNFGQKYIRKLVRIYQDFPFTPTYPNGVMLLYLFPAILLGLGIFTGEGKWSDRHSDRFLLFWLLPLLLCLPIIFVEVRYYVPAVVLLIPFMARGAVQIGKWIVESFSRIHGVFSKLLLGPAVNVVLIVFILLAAPKITYKITHWSDPMVSYNPREAAADWIVTTDYEADRIMEYAHSVSFYSGAQSILIPDGNLEDIVRIARKYDTELLSLDEFYCLRADRRPKINYLFDLDRPPPAGLERVYTDTENNQLRHVIYRIKSPDEPGGLPAQ